MVEQACGALTELSAERQIHVQFAARLGAVGAAFMQQADMQDAARHDVLQDEAKAILRREGRRKRQIERRSRASQAKSARAGQDQSEPVHRARGDSRSRSSRRRHQSARSWSAAGNALTPVGAIQHARLRLACSPVPP